MSRVKRITLGGYAYHVLNRSNGKLRIFRKNGDFLAFEKILSEGIQKFEMRLCGYSIMSNHWHLLLWPAEDGQLSAFMHWITMTHTQRYHASHPTASIGHLYQGRFKSFPIQEDCHYLTVMRYIEANPVHAGIVSNAGQWPWSSFAVRYATKSEFELSDGPVELPNNWEHLVNKAEQTRQIELLEKSIKRGSPFGEPIWRKKTATKMGLESTMKPRGRPQKGS